MKDALALINSQEQRIEKLAVELEAMRCAANSYKMHNKELTEENERLRAERDILDVLVKDLRGRNNGLQRANESLAKDCDILEDELNECVQIKADTVRKMHSEIKERCLKGGIYPAFVASTIDQIAKEMMEDKK
jgi:chromosome segregation ATPase